MYRILFVYLHGEMIKRVIAILLVVINLGVLHAQEFRCAVSVNYQKLMSTTQSYESSDKKVFENMNLDGKLRNWTINLSNACFGIYLVHLFFIRNVLWNIDWLASYGGIFQIVVTTILTLTFSYLTTFLLSKLPFSKYLIGY